MIRKFFIPLLVVVVSIFGAIGLLATSPVLEPTIPEPLPTVVSVIEVAPENLRLTVGSQGTIAPRTESELIPEVAGRVVWMSPSLAVGGHFKTGEVLLRVDAEDYESRVGRAQAALKRSTAELELAQYEHKRLTQLEGRQLVSRSQLENAVRALRVAEAAYADATMSTREAQRDLRRTELRAPFDGRVRTEKVDVGQFINRGNSIGTIYASDTVEVRLPVADRQLAFLNIPFGYQGDASSADAPTVMLSAEFAGEKLEWEAKVVRTEAEIDAKSRMVNVIAEAPLDPNSRLSVGLFVSAEIQGLEVEDVFVLPRAALRNGDQVLVVDDENRLAHRTIEPLRLYQDKVIVKNGLAGGERICISQLQTVIDGMRVSPVAAGADEPSA